MPFDFLIDKSTGDIVFEDGDIALVSSNQRRVRQEIELTLKTFQGEWFHDINFGGINKEILYSKTSTKSEVDAWFKSIITSFPEVVRIASFESEYNVNTRDYDVNFSVLTTEGELDVKVRPDLEVIYRQFIAEIITPVCGAKIISAAITGESAMSVFIGTLAASGAVISGESTLTALIGKSYANQAVSGDSVMNVGMVKVISASLDGFSTFSTNLYKNINVASISGESTFMSAIYSYIQSAIQGQATVTANIAKIIAAVINDNQGTLVATTNTAIGAIISGQATLTGTMMRVFSSTIADNDSVMTVSLSRLITASLTGSDGSLNAIIRKRIESSINDNQGNMSANINRALSMVVSGQGTMTSSVRKLLSATLVEFPSDISVSISKPGASVIGGSDTSTFAIYKIKPIASAIVESPATFTANINRALGASISQTGEMARVDMWWGSEPQQYDWIFREAVSEDSQERANGAYWKLDDSDVNAITNDYGYTNQFDYTAPNQGRLFSSTAVTKPSSSSAISRIPEAKSINWNSSSSSDYLNASLSEYLPGLTPYHLTFFINTPSSFSATRDVVSVVANSAPAEPYYRNIRLVLRSDGRFNIVFGYGDISATSTATYLGNLVLSANKRYYIRLSFYPATLSSAGPRLFVNNVQVSTGTATIAGGFSWTTFLQDSGTVSLRLSGIQNTKIERLAYFMMPSSNQSTNDSDFTEIYRFAINPDYDEQILSLNPLCYLPLDSVYSTNQLIDITQNGTFQTGRSVVPTVSPISGYTAEASIPLVEYSGALASAGTIGNRSLGFGDVDTSSLSDQYSVCFWHKKPVSEDSITPYYLWRTINGIGHLQRTGSSYIFNFVNGQVTMPSSSIQLNQDVFIVCKVNKTAQTASIWVNGTLISSSAVFSNPTGIWANTTELRVDSDYPAGISYFAGVTGNVYERFAILPVDLTQSQIQELYRIGNKW